MSVVATKAMLIAVDEIALELVKGFKDGVQVGDFVTFWNDYQNSPDLKAKLQAAFAMASQVPNEIAHIGISDVVELALEEVSYVPRFIEALKA